ncbi:MAG TPA: UDP-N-acetylmuramate dehydrogenase [Steroidobacteraceae bacterium]|jgi:UDP-N-acetylmuramate dehydrogenase|nr:UDP-N-acetylmuramate dehydrogenase [Steroidobacteraceae bacterium]
MMQVAEKFLPRVRRHEPMSRHTSWHAGGAAEIYFTPRDRADLRAFLGTVPAGTPIHFLGLGSNLLVRDGGIRGVVVATQEALLRLERLDETTVYGEAGVPCARIARQCIQWQLAGAEFFAGIPGTLGGALAMNAGAFGAETWNCVVSVETLDRHGAQHTRVPGEYSVSYRHVSSNRTDEWFAAAHMSFTHAPGIDDSALRDLLARRRESQPIGEWSCGSVFKNPPGDHAARLIETAGLKGLRVGDASVSLKHANFIINHGAATASDLEQLVQQVQAQVLSAHGVALQPEVRIVGEVL